MRRETIIILQVKSWSKPANIEDLIGIKKVDHSLFIYGIHIPVAFRTEFQNANQGQEVEIGTARKVILIINDQRFEVELRNIQQNSSDLNALQIRYDNKYKITDYLTQAFRYSYEYIKDERCRTGKSNVVVPDHIAEYLKFYKTDNPFEYRIELVQNASRLLPDPYREICERKTVNEMAESDSDEQEIEFDSIQETSELVQLKLNIETSVEGSTPTEAEYGGPLPLVEVGVSLLDEVEEKIDDNVQLELPYSEDIEKIFEETIWFATTLREDIEKRQQSIIDLQTFSLKYLRKTSEQNQMIQEMKKNEIEWKETIKKQQESIIEMLDFHKDQIKNKDQEIDSGNRDLAVKNQELDLTNQELIAKGMLLAERESDLAVKNQELDLTNQELIAKGMLLAERESDLEKKIMELDIVNQELIVKNMLLVERDTELNITTQELESLRAEKSAAKRSFIEFVKVREAMQNIIKLLRRDNDSGQVDPSHQQAGSVKKEIS